MENLHDKRQVYEQFELHDHEVKENPMEHFKEWFADADKHPDIFEANAMILSTIDDDGCPRLHKKWSCPSLHSGIPSRISLCLRQDNCTVVRRYIPSIALSKFHTYSLYIPSKRNASQSGIFAMADIFDLLFDGANIDAFKALFPPFLLTAYLWL